MTDLENKVSGCHAHVDFADGDRPAQLQHERDQRRHQDEEDLEGQACAGYAVVGGREDRIVEDGHLGRRDGGSGNNNKHQHGTGLGPYQWGGVSETPSE